MKQYARPIAFLVLALVTVVYFRSFFLGDWQETLRVWRGQYTAIAIALALNVVGIVAEYFCWAMQYRRFGIPVFSRRGAVAFGSVFAALLLPLQAGRLVRPDGVVRQGLGTLPPALKAEAVVFYMDVLSLGMLIAGFGTGLVSQEWLQVGSVLAVLLGCVAYGMAGLVGFAVATQLAGWLGKTRLAIPSGFWFQWSMAGLLVLHAINWLSAASVLYVLVRELPSAPPAAQVMFSALLSSMLGSGTGLPGGLGVTEGFLGWFLTMAALPAAHMAIAVGLFRLITFWLQVPLGWAALAWLSIHAPRAPS